MEHLEPIGTRKKIFSCHLFNMYTLRSLLSYNELFLPIFGREI